MIDRTPGADGKESEDEGVAKAKAARDEITAAVDVLERFTYRIDDEAEAPIRSAGKRFLNEERELPG